MNRIVNNVRLFAGINLVGLTSLAMAARFHQDVPPDAAPPFRTHVLHRSAPVAVQEDHAATVPAPSWRPTGDPVGWSTRGEPFLLPILLFSGRNKAGGLYVRVGENNPKTGPLPFPPPPTPAVVSTHRPATTTFEDKEWIAVDN